MALLWILMVRPVGWSDLTFQEDQLSGFDGRAVTECPGGVPRCDCVDCRKEVASRID